MLFLVIKNMLARYTLVLYLRCFKIAELLSLISFYASLNYFVVRELGSLLLDNPIQPNEEIPLAGFSGFALPSFRQHMFITAFTGRISFL